MEELFVILAMSLFCVCSGLKCYTCTYQYSGTSRDKECVDEPWNVKQGQKVFECPYPYCVIYRQVLQATKQVYSFHRGCEQDSRGNKCVIDSYYSTCSYTCTTDLCNADDGIPAADEVGQDYVGPAPPGVEGPPEPEVPVRKTGSDVAKRNRKKKRKGPNQITCLNPYACDQSRFWPKGGCVSVHGDFRLFWLVIVIMRCVGFLS